MPTTSAQFAAKAALVDTLDAALDVDVEWGYSGRPEKKAVYVGNIKGTQEPAAIGTNRPRRENFTIDVTVSVAGKGTQRAVTEQAYTLAAEFEAALFADHTLDGAVELAMLSDSDLREGANGDGGRIAYIDYTVEVRATLR